MIKIEIADFDAEHTQIRVFDHNGSEVLFCEIDLDPTDGWIYYGPEEEILCDTKEDAILEVVKHGLTLV